MSRIARSLLVAVCFVSACAWAVSAQQEAGGQTAEKTPTIEYVPRTQGDLYPSVGFGIGIPYGVIGGRLGMGVGPVSLDLGAGLFPIAWEPVISIGSSLYLTDRLATVRPKVTATYSTAVAAILIYEQGSLDEIFSEFYDGVAVYGGVDWRLGKTSPITLDLNIGAIFPSVGIDKVKDDFDRVIEDLTFQGFNLEDQSEPRTFPFLSLGVTFTPGRALKMDFK